MCYVIGRRLDDRSSFLLVPNDITRVAIKTRIFRFFVYTNFSCFCIFWKIFFYSFCILRRTFYLQTKTKPVKSWIIELYHQIPSSQITGFDFKAVYVSQIRRTIKIISAFWRASGEFFKAFQNAVFFILVVKSKNQGNMLRFLCIQSKEIQSFRIKLAVQLIYATWKKYFRIFPHF